MLRTASLTLLVLAFLALVGQLGCGQSSWCPDCGKATPVTALNYQATQTLGQGTAVTALAPSPAGGTVISYMITSGSLPPGLTLDPVTGRITGTPTTPGVYTFVVQATNNASAVSQPVTLTVLPSAPLALTYPTPRIFRVGAAISLQAPTLTNATPGIATVYSLSNSSAVTSLVRGAAEVAGGTLPAGLSLNADGSITGIPTVAGSYTFKVTAINGTRSTSASVAYVVTSASALSLGYTMPAVVTEGSPITTQAPVVTNATPGVVTTYVVTTGALPAGLTLNTDGTVTGTPATPGVYTFSITATNGSLTASSGSITVVEVPAAAMNLAYTGPQTVKAGTAIAAEKATLTHAIPGLAVTFAISSDSLPAGLTLGADGTISGTPTTPGVYAWTVTAANGVQTASAALAVTVVAANDMTLNYTFPPTLTQGTDAGVQAPAVDNATPGVPMTFAVTSGTLPVGLTLNADGTVSGTPTTPGVYPFSITVTNGTRTATSNLTVTVVSSAALRLAYPALAPLTQGTEAGVQTPVLANATPGVATTFAVTGGTLPPGMVLNADGTITGTPTTPGVYTWTVTATNGTLSAAGGATYTVVAASPMTISYPNPGVLTNGSSITAVAPTVTNATPGVATTYAITSGTLPAGLTLNGDGTITGTPTTPGVHILTVTATNGTLSASSTLTVTSVSADPLTLGYPAVSPFTQGVAISTQVPSMGNATPGVTLAYAVTSGSLPVGLTLNLDGTITGTPTTPGVSTWMVTATNGTRSSNGGATYTVVSASPMTLSYPTPVLLPLGAAASTQSPTVANGTPGLATTYAVSAGSLPTGLLLNADGTITGTPTVSGSFSPTIQATNGTRTATSTPNYTVASAAPSALNYTSPVTYTTGYSIGNNSPNPAGGTPSSYTVTSGSLPTGLVLDASTGIIRGTPTTSVNAASVTIRGANSQGSASQTLVITVLGAPTAALSSNPSTVTVGQSSSLTALLSNGTGVISGGNLASPVTVTDGVSIPTGIVNAPASYTYTLTVTSPLGHIVTSTAQVDWIVEPANSYSTPLSSSGGTYTPPSGNPLYGEISITVPAQAASCGAATLTVNTEATLPGSIPSGVKAYSETFNLTTDVGYPFRTPMTVTLAYTPTLASPNLTAADVPMAFYWDPTYSAWVTTGVKAINTTNHTVTFTTLLPGRYAILAIPGLASALATDTLGFTPGTDDWLQNNLDIYDLPNGASLGMGSYASWYFNFAKPSRGTGLYNIFTSASDANALALISRVANGTLEEWDKIWEQKAYGLTNTQTGLGLITGLQVTGQPQLFLMGDARPAVNNALATLVTSYNASTGAFGVIDPNYPGNTLTITWTAGTGAFSGYDRAMAYSPALAEFALEGQTSVHRLADYATAMDGASAGYPAGTYASIEVTNIGGAASPDLSQTVKVSSASNVTVRGTVTNGDQTETSLYWSQNLNAPRTAVTLTPVDSTHSSFDFSIPALANPYGTQVMLETTSNPCDPTFSHSGFQSFTLAQTGLSAWFPNVCFENSPTSAAPWVNQEGSNAGINYPNPTAYASNTFSTTGTLNSYAIPSWTTASTYSAVVNNPAHANDTNMGTANPIAMVLDGDNSFRVDSSLTGSHISKVSQTITVPNTISHPKLSFYWSFLAQSAGHAPNQEPFVDIVVYDLTTHEVLYYVHHFPPTTYNSVYYTDGYPGWVSGSGSGSSQWFGINWQKVSLNLGTSRGNDQILISVTAAGCNQGGHAGYAYLDSIGCN